MRSVLCFVVCLWVPTALATSVLVAAEPCETVKLTNDLKDLIQSRRKAISTIEIAADRVLASRNTLNPNTPEAIQGILERYVSSDRSDEDRSEMYLALRAPAFPGKSITRTVRYFQKGDWTSVFDNEQLRYVTDDRASVVTEFTSLNSLRAIISEPGKATSLSAELSSFSFELESRYVIPTVPYEIAVDDRGQFVITWKDSSGTDRAEISGDDGVLNRREHASANGESVIAQLGRIETPEGVPFPAIVASSFFKEGSLVSLQLLVTKSVKVNQPIDKKVFHVAVPVGSSIADSRDSEERLAPKDVEDVVDFVSAQRKNQSATP